MVKGIEEAREEYDVELSQPVDFSLLEKSQNINARTVKLGKMDGVIEDLDAERKRIEEYLEKYNTVSMVSDVKENEAKILNNLKALDEQVDELTAKRTDLSSKLETVTDDRRKLFNSFVGRVKPILSDSYRILTSQAEQSGNADIYIESQDLPF